MRILCINTNQLSDHPLPCKEDTYMLEEGRVYEAELKQGQCHNCLRMFDAYLIPEITNKYLWRVEYFVPCGDEEVILEEVEDTCVVAILSPEHT